MVWRTIAGKPTVDVPAWPPFDDQEAEMEFHLPVAGIGGQVAGDGLLTEAAVAEMQGYLQLNDVAGAEAVAELAGGPVDAYSCDEFRMYDFKVRRCARGRSHDWTECPYAHPGEKARRRDPRKHHYSGAACPEFRKGICTKGESCEFSHGVFECWLHPARYRTQPCKDGTACRRRVCFFAHSPEQLRVLPPVWAADSYDGSPMRHRAIESYFSKGLGLVSESPTSTLISIWPDSPPISPIGRPIRRDSWPMGSLLNGAIESLRNVRVSPAVESIRRDSWPMVSAGGLLPGFCSSPSTPMRVAASCGGWLNLEGVTEMDEAVDGVESVAALQDEMYGRLKRDGGMETSGDDPAAVADDSGGAPDFEWVSELIE